MDKNYALLNKDEEIIYDLRNIYSLFGYSSFKMSKFEEYDFYSKNKDFLVSDSLITFTDTNGKLLALKPDVTLSLIKNSLDKSNTLQRYCYNENVYRISKNTNSFKEIMQVGLECIGDIDCYAINEVLLLACLSLKSISKNYVLDVSSLDLLEVVLSKLNLSYLDQKEMLKFIEEKNIGEIEKKSKDKELDKQYVDILVSLITLPSSPSIALPLIKEIAISLNQENLFNNLDEAIKGLDKENIRIDFSVISDLSYYNGIVFKGFIEGVPTSSLSGGQYDKLMKKLKKKSKGIGFAVYLDTLSFLQENNPYDADIMVIYTENNSFLQEYVFKARKENKRVFVSKEVNTKIKYKQLVQIKGNEVVILENNA